MSSGSAWLSEWHRGMRRGVLLYRHMVHDCGAGICKIVPPVSAVVPGSLVLSHGEGKGFRFTTRQQMLSEPHRTSFSAMNPFTDGTKCACNGAKPQWNVEQAPRLFADDSC